MKDIQDLIDFFEAIPAERWTKGTLSSWAGNVKPKEPEQNCAFGHLNKHLFGHWDYREKKDSWDLVNSLGVAPIKMVEVNNYGLADAKTNVITFLKEKLHGNNTTTD